MGTESDGLTMEPHKLHAWDLSPQEAIRVQVELRQKLALTWDGREVCRVAGVDIGLTEDRARAAVVVLRYPDLTPLEGVTAEAPLTLPYIPGLLSFREGPAILAAWAKLKIIPDLVMFDGQGIAHPRGLGIAAQMGLWLNLPTIGVAKSRLYGTHVEPGSQPGDYAELRVPRHPEQVIGAVLRTKRNVKPLYISPGHLMDVPYSIQFVMDCVTAYRLPETTRWAHRVAGGEKLPVEEAQQGNLFDS